MVEGGVLDGDARLLANVGDGQEHGVIVAGLVFKKFVGKEVGEGDDALAFQDVRFAGVAAEEAGDQAGRTSRGCLLPCFE